MRFSVDSGRKCRQNRSMKFTSQVIASGSGSVGGCVYSRNRYGPYIRNRSIPTNPNTYNQVAVRNAFAQLATYWNTSLTLGQRNAWDAYAAAVPRVDPLGNQIYTTGLNWYIGCNVQRIASLGAPGIIDDAPVLFNMATLTLPVISGASEATGLVTFSYDNTDPWAATDDGYLFVTFSQGMNVSRNFFKGPFRGNRGGNNYIAGDTATPPTSPGTLAPTPAIVQGQRIFARFIASNADGRISLPVIAAVNVAA